MALFGNELMKADEDEEDFDELNDVTFGDSAVVYNEDWEWEKDHKLIADVVLKGADHDHVTQFLQKHSADYENNDEDLGIDENDDLKSNLRQLVVDDDDEEEDEDCNARHSMERKAVNLDELFGPSSPPGIFQADDFVLGHQNIWGSPVREGRLDDRNAGLKSFLKSLQTNYSVSSGGGGGSGYQPVIIQPPQQRHQQQQQMMSADVPKCFPLNAKTLEEIEDEMMNGGKLKMALTAEEVERQLKAGSGDQSTYESGASLTNNDQSSHQSNAGGGSPSVDQLSNVPPHVQPLVRIPIVPAMPGIGTLLGSSYLSMHAYGRGGAGGGGGMPFRGMAPMPIHNQSPVDQRQRWPTGPSPSPHHMLPHMPPSNLNYILASRPGFPFGMNRHVLPRIPGGFPYNGPHPHMQNNQVFPNGRQQNFHPSRNAPPPASASSSIIHQQHILQQQQLFQQQQMMRQHGYDGGVRPPWLNQMNQWEMERRRVGIGRAEEENMQTEEDEYAGLMQQREKDWIIKIQLLQLYTDNPYIDDYYFTCWSLKKMLREKQKEEGVLEKSKSNDNEPTLVLPQLAKLEMRAYEPVQFEGSLGRLTASSIHNPRQIINVHFATTSEHEESHHLLERKRFKEVLLEIEKGYDLLLNIDDLEKKALAQPPEARSEFHSERRNLILNLYQSLLSKSAASSSSSETTKTQNRPTLSQIISIRKGLALVTRLLPLLETSDSQSFARSLLRKLQFVMKKEKQEEDWPKFYRAISLVIETSELEVLVLYSMEINKDLTAIDDISRRNNIMSVLQNKLGVSLVLSLINRGEVIYSTVSPLDLDADEQFKWRSFVQLVADAFENLDKDAFDRPFEFFSRNVPSHFVRFLEKRQLLAIEDKLETILSVSVESTH